MQDCDSWVNQFDGQSSVEFGLDTEHRAPQRKGEKPGILSVLQLVCLCCFKRPGQIIGAIFNLQALQVLPDSLVALLQRAKLGGVSIQSSDIDKLVRDRTTQPVYSLHIPQNVVDLTDLAIDVLRLQRAQVRSLEKVLAQCCPGRRLNKNLVNVRFYAWDQWPLCILGQRYAINDAYAGALALRRLLHPNLGPLKQSAIRPAGNASASEDEDDFDWEAVESGNAGPSVSATARTGSSIFNASQEGLSLSLSLSLSRPRSRSFARSRSTSFSLATKRIHTILVSLSLSQTHTLSPEEVQKEPQGGIQEVAHWGVFQEVLQGGGHMFKSVDTTNVVISVKRNKQRSAKKVRMSGKNKIGKKKRQF